MTSARDFNQAAALQFFDESVDAADAHADRFGERVLTRKAQAVVPSIAEEECVCCLSANRYGGIAQDEIGKLREAVARDWIGGIELDVLLNFFEAAANVAAKAMAFVPIEERTRLLRGTMSECARGGSHGTGRSSDNIWRKLVETYGVRHPRIRATHRDHAVVHTRTPIETDCRALTRVIFAPSIWT